MVTTQVKVHLINVKNKNMVVEGYFREGVSQSYSPRYHNMTYRDIQ